MRILWLRPSKAENISVGRHRIAEKLREKGHTVNIQEATFQSFRRVLKEDHDIIIGTTRLGAFVGTWGKFVNGTPLVIDHIDPIEQFKRNNNFLLTWVVTQAEKLSFRYADHVIVIYEEEVPRVEKYAKSITKTSLGVEYESFSDPSEESVEEAWSMLSEHVEPEDKILIYVGGLEPIYRLPSICDAMEKLEDWQFIVLGDGSQRELVNTVAEKTDNIHYLGTVPHETIPGLMNHADVGISLVDDRNSLKVLEYGASGLSVVHIKGDAENLFEGMVEFCEPVSEDIACAVREAHESGSSEELRKLTEKRSWDEIAGEYEKVLWKAVNK